MAPVLVAMLAALLQVIPPSSAQLSGRIIDHSTGAPIPGAQITLFPDPGESGRSNPSTWVHAVSGPDGSYAFPPLPPGAYRLRTHKQGFVDVTRSPALRVTLEANGAPVRMDFTLSKGAVIAGRVLDPLGQPLVGAHVLALRSMPYGDSTRLVPVGGAMPTDDGGEFRIFGLIGGEYFVAATPWPSADPASADKVWLTTYFPGTPKEDEARSLTVQTGDTSSDVVIQLVTAPAFMIRGVVVDGQGQAVANAMVRVLTARSGFSDMGMASYEGSSGIIRTDGVGAFALRAPSGTHTLLAIAPVTLSQGPGRGPPGQRHQGDPFHVRRV